MATVTHNAYSEDFGRFGESIGPRNNGSSAMSPVAIAAGGFPPRGTSPEGGVQCSVCWIR